MTRGLLTLVLFLCGIGFMLYSASLGIPMHLEEMGAEQYGYDPMINPSVQMKTLYSMWAALGFAALGLIVGWPIFKEIEQENNKKRSQ